MSKYIRIYNHQLELICFKLFGYTVTIFFNSSRTVRDLRIVETNNA